MTNPHELINLAKWDAATSGKWGVSFPTVTSKRTFKSGIAKIASVFALLASPLTTGGDVWLRDQRRRLSLSKQESFSPFARRLSPIQAREIALAILARAERLRDQAATLEARHGIALEDDS